MKRISTLLLCTALTLSAQRARNVILFIGDAGGIPTLHAASVYGYNVSAGLFVQRMPHMGLMDTSAANAWVPDSASAMTAIVTGRKTDNGVVSKSVKVAGSKERKPLKTILEYAEERGLSTGIVTNSALADATPAACYAHADSRDSTGEIFAEMFKPKYGDGVDVMIWSGRKTVGSAIAKLGIDLEPALRARSYRVYDSLDAIPGSARRFVGLFDSGDYDLNSAVGVSTRALAGNPRGYFLMVEWDVHTNNVRKGLDHVIELDRVIRQTVSRVGSDTLVIFAADHSYDLRVRAGRPDAPLVPDLPPDKDGKIPPNPNVLVEDGHTAEQVLVTAQGPGSDKVRGFFANTDLFRFMMSAYGWSASRGGD